MQLNLGEIPDWLVVNAVRYATGRATYVVQETVEWLLASWPRLPGPVQEQIRRDIESEFRRDDDVRSQGYTQYLPLGHDIDRQQWEKVRELWKERA